MCLLLKGRRKGVLAVLILFTFLMTQAGFFFFPQPSGATDSSKVFKDVYQSDPDGIFIKYLKSSGIVKGLPDGSFRPQNLVTRAEAIYLLMKALGKEDKLVKLAGSFKDVPSGHWAAGAIAAASADGIVKGLPDHTFQPQKAITLAEAMTLLLNLGGERLAKADQAVAVDTPAKHWASGALAASMEAGFISPDAKGRLNPDKVLGRGGFARYTALTYSMLPENRQGELKATIRVLKGELWYKQGDSEKKISSPMTIETGQSFRTGPGTEAEIGFEDGSTIKLAEKTDVTIVKMAGSKAIRRDGTPITAVEVLEMKLQTGKLFGALSSPQSFILQPETSKPEKLKYQPGLLSYGQAPQKDQSKAKLITLANQVDKKQKQPWYLNSTSKRVRVKVDMPAGVAGIRGTFWMNEVSAQGQFTNVLRGEAEVTAHGQTVELSAGQATKISSAAAPPEPPKPMAAEQVKEWVAQKEWITEKAAIIEQVLPVNPVTLPLVVPKKDSKEPAESDKIDKKPVGEVINLAEALLGALNSAANEAGVPVSNEPPKTGSSGSNSSSSPVAVTGLSLNYLDLALTAGGTTATLIATVTPENATNKEVNWSTSDSSVAIVSNGVVTPAGVGTATITASAGGVSATCIVTVSNHPIDIIEPPIDIIEPPSDPPNPPDPISSKVIRLNSLERVSQSSAGVAANYSSTNETISADGRYVTFVSPANNLVNDVFNGYNNIFVRDRITGNIERANLDNNGALASGGAGQPRLSSDGRYVVFSSSSSTLVTNDTNGDGDIFVRDRVAGKTVRVSIATDGTQANNGSFGPGWPDISANGRFVVFSSDDTTLFPGDSIQDIFVRDRDADGDGIYDEPGQATTSLVSISTTGGAANGTCYFPRISPNGRFVIFFSSANNLVEGVTTDGMFVRDLQNNTTKFFAAVTGQPEFSSDGRYLTFTASDSANLVSGDNNQCADIFVMDRDNDQDGVFDETAAVSYTRVSLGYNGQEPNQSANSPSISGDGRFITYISAASNIVPNDTNNKYDVFVHDRQLKLTKRVSVSRTGLEGNDDSLNEQPSISFDGSYITFRSYATNLVGGDTNGQLDIFLAGLNYDSTADLAAPADPPAQTVAAVGPSWAKLTWGPASDNIFTTSYEVYRGTNMSGPFSKLATVDGLVYSYWDLDLTTNTDYYYYIRAVDEDGNRSIPSTPVHTQTTALLTSAADIIHIAAAGEQSFARKVDGTAWGWGNNNYDQLGQGSETLSYYSSPVPVKGSGGTGQLSGVAAFTGGYRHALALKTDGTVWGWGDNGYGQLGTGGYTDLNTPAQTLGAGGSGFLTGVISLATNDYCSMALKEDGTVWVWGDNLNGQLGKGDYTDRLTPGRVFGPGGDGYLVDIKAIAMGDGHSVALKSDGTVWTWGNNGSGQLGNGYSGYSYSKTTPVQVLGPGGSGYLDGIVAITAGDYHTLALKNDGTVWAWGENSDGQLGQGDNNSRSIPVQVYAPDGELFLSGVQAIDAGQYFSMALLESGTVLTWGDNYNGALGSGNKTDRTLPGLVLGQGGTGTLAGITAIAAGGYHALALKDDGTVWGWGAGYRGQLGNSGTSEQTSPVQAAGFNLDDVTPDTVTPNWLSGASLKAPVTETNYITLEWPSANDNRAITGYKIFKDGIYQTSLGADKFSYPYYGLVPNTTYSFQIEAGDAAGNWTSDGPEITISTGKQWQLETLDSLDWVGQYSSVQLDSYGYPHISYSYQSAEDLRYIYKDSFGWHTEVVDTAGSVGRWTSLVLVNGRPHISYTRLDTNELKYAFKDDSGWNIQSADSQLYISDYTSLVIDSYGYPHISYHYDNGYGSSIQTKYAYKDSNGWHRELLGTGANSSLVLDIAGNPHISFYDSVNQDLIYTYKDGQGWYSQVIDSGGQVGEYTSIAIDSYGYPSISYFDRTNKDLKFAFRDESGWHIETVDGTNDVGWETSLVMDADGIPHIAYRDMTSYSYKLKYAYKDNSGWHSMVVQQGDQAYPSIALNGTGIPYISYNGDYDSSYNDLVIAHQ